LRNIFWGKSQLNELSHLSLGKVSVLVLIKFLKHLLKLVFIVVHLPITVDHLHDLIQELRRLTFVQEAVIVCVALRPNFIQRLLELDLVVLQERGKRFLIS
jgi:hypothetical protein